MFDFSIITNWFDGLLRSVLPAWGAILVECVAVALIVITLSPYLRYSLSILNAKYVHSSNAVSDLIVLVNGDFCRCSLTCSKCLQKEIIFLKNTDRVAYMIAPVMVILASFLTFSCIPWNKGAQVLDFNVGVFFFLAASSLGIVGILLAGIGSRNKYSLIGAMRAGAQIISYELSIGMTMLTMIALTGTMQFFRDCGRTG